MNIIVKMKCQCQYHFISLILMAMVELIFHTPVAGDVYLHNPRGSNNRLDEKGRARANANSLFDSQNNERGGYNVGSVFYYQGSKVSIEWTNQHSCHNTNNNCEMILQYMCSDSIRDGVTTQTIPTNRAQCENYNCNTDRRYRMNENYEYYLACSTRERNKGLFTADQNLNNRHSARSTRQNPQGTRRGYECPEERDHYPYWHASPWVDIVVLTNDVSRCHYYKQESHNVKDRWACVLPIPMMQKILNKVPLPNNKEACEKFELPKKITGEPRKPTWVKIPAHGLPAPDCRETEYTRDNHLGNTYGGHPATYDWTIPNYLENENCVIRIRYNISTSDYDSWKTNASVNANPKKLNAGSLINMAEKVGLPTLKDAQDRGYVFENNPVTKVFEGLDLDLRLAINTAQFGRTFQDRTHTFAVRRRPADLKTATIHNLNVRGKRGNIVQVYPAVEYDFVPNDLEIVEGDYVHVQWTGSNTNPGNNDGQGLAGSDRNNIVLLARQAYPEGKGSGVYTEQKHGHYGRNFAMDINNASFLGLSNGDALTLALVDPGQFRGEVSELDDAGTYFNLPPRRATRSGTYHYMSTRNNNFSNRDQKGRVTVLSTPFEKKAIGSMGGVLSLRQGNAKMIVEEGAFDALKKVRLEHWSTGKGEKMMRDANKELSAGDNYASDFYVITPDELISEGKSSHFTLEMKVNDDDSDIHIYHASSDMSTWNRLDANVDGGVARVQARQGGIYVARGVNNIGMIVGIVVACVVVVIIIAGSIFYFRRNPSKWQAVRTTCTAAERSMKDRV